MDVQTKGLFLPSFILFDKTLNSNEKIIMSIIHGYEANAKTKKCWLSNSGFAKYLNIKLPAVSTVINNLVEEGKIISDLDKSKGNKRMLKIGYSKEEDSYSKEEDSYSKKEDSYSKKEEHNNNINIIINNITNPSSSVQKDKEEGEVLEKVNLNTEMEMEMEMMINCLLDFFKVITKEDKSWLTKQLKKLEFDGYLEEFKQRTRAYIRVHRDFGDKVGKYKTTMRKYIAELWSAKDWGDYYAKLANG